MNKWNQNITLSGYVIDWTIWEISIQDKLMGWICHNFTGGKETEDWKSIISESVWTKNKSYNI